LIEDFHKRGVLTSEEKEAILKLWMRLSYCAFLPPVLSQCFQYLERNTLMFPQI